MDSDYRKTINHGIEICSVKTDAFTINQQSLSMAHEILDFNANIGGWRCSKNCDIVTTNKPIMQFKQTGTERKIVCKFIMFKKQRN